MYSEELKNTLEVLSRKHIILYPTDTVWGLGCDATDEKSVSKIFKLKKRESSKSLVVLVSSLEMLKKYVTNVPDEIIELLSGIKKPTTIIYSAPVNLANNVIASDNTVGIRIVSSGFCHDLIEQFGKPIISTSANISGDTTPLVFKDISRAILDNVDYIVNLNREKVSVKSSSIIRILNDASIKIIRE